ncbi:BQ2448_4301 [Microbotryum intermedium]|uniref:BQ2448_4301 protein n=1 Tax=Microbotryum intermedium TaxID=269621 RepID=A0A238FLL9_9BASI|nr:BQ2448_4301 [Microbotryum intermedium]
MTNPSLPIATHKLSSGKTVSLSRLGQQLIMTTQPQPPFEDPKDGVEVPPVDEDGPIWAVLSNMVPEDPFPGFSTQGNEMFWRTKAYWKNASKQDGYDRKTGRTFKQAFVVYPMCELRLDEQALAHHCPSCDRYESILDKQRFKRCVKCRKRYYCSAKCQKNDWPSHKLDCKDLAAGRLALVENRKRNETRQFFEDLAGGPQGFTELTL